MFYDFVVSGACCGESFVVAWRPGIAYDTNYLDMRLTNFLTNFYQIFKYIFFKPLRLLGDLVLM